jgi:hypothetical protein
MGYFTPYSSHISLQVTVRQFFLVEVEHSSTHLVRCIKYLIILNYTNENWLIPFEIAQSTVIGLNYEYTTILVSIMQYCTIVKNYCLSSYYHLLSCIPSSTIQFYISKYVLSIIMAVLYCTAVVVYLM